MAPIPKEPINNNYGRAGCGCGKPSDKCGTVLPASCIEWQGELPNCIPVPPGFCIDSIKDVFVLYGAKICELDSAINLDGLDKKCLTLVAPYTINAVIQDLINQFCPIIDEVNQHDIWLHDILHIVFDSTILNWANCFDFGPCHDVSELDTLAEVLQVLIDKICECCSTGCKVAISANDTCCNYLGSKITAGDNITITTINNQGCETLVISGSSPTPALRVQDGYTPPVNQVSNVTTLIANGYSVQPGPNPGEAILKAKLTIFQGTPESIAKATGTNFVLPLNSDAKVIHGWAGTTPNSGVWHYAVFGSYTMNDANISYDDNNGTFIINDSGFYNISGLISLRPGGDGGTHDTQWGSAGWIKAGISEYLTSGEYISELVPMLDGVSGITEGQIFITFRRDCVQLTAGQKLEFRVLNKTGTDYTEHNNGGHDIMSLTFTKIFDVIP